MNADPRWMGAAMALAERGVGRTAPNPAVGCVIVRDDRVLGRGWTQPGGRPHAEADALAQAGAGARGATAYVTLEPCAHRSARGPACADLLIEAGVARVVAATVDPDPRTAGAGLERLGAAGIAVTPGVREGEARAILAGFLSRVTRGRPRVTLQLATSLDGCIATAADESRWITGERARAHVHLARARAELIVVGGGTLRADAPRLDVRLAGLEARAPRRAVLTRTAAPDGWVGLAEPGAIAGLGAVNDIYLEGGAGAAAAFLAADLVDRLHLYGAPVLIGGGRPALGDIGLHALAEAHGRWRLADARMLGSDRFEAYERRR